MYIKSFTLHDTQIVYCHRLWAGILKALLAEKGPTPVEVIEQIHHKHRDTGLLGEHAQSAHEDAGPDVTSAIHVPANKHKPSFSNWIHLSNDSA